MANTKNIKVVDEKNNDSVEEVVEPKAPRIQAKDIDPTQTIMVRNGYHGKLIYKSKRTGETIKWDGFNDEQEMELRELRNAKSASKSFFSNNWFMFDSDNEWVIDYLGLNQYYKYALKIDDIDALFSKSASEIKKIVPKLSSGQKKTVEYRARTLIGEGQIDSLNIIHTLEEVLNTDLIEK